MSSGAIGEHYAICELLRLGFTPLISPNPVQRGWDVIVFDCDNFSSVRLQVKAVNWSKDNINTKPVITGNFSGAFDFLVVVVINFDTETKYNLYVIPKSDLESTGNGKGALPSKINEKIRYKNKTIPFSTFATPNIKKIWDDQYKDNWPEVQKLLTLRSSGAAQKAAQPA